MGSSSPGLKWPYLSFSYMVGLDLYKALSNFVNSPGIDWLNFKACPDVYNLEILDSSDYVIPFSCGDENSRIVWLLKNINKDLKNVNFNSLNVIVSGLENGSYVVEFWDTYSGKILDKRNVNARNRQIEFKVDLSNQKDIAVKIYKTLEH